MESSASAKIPVMCICQAGGKRPEEPVQALDSKCRFTSWIHPARVLVCPVRGCVSASRLVLVVKILACTGPASDECLVEILFRLPSRCQKKKGTNIEFGGLASFSVHGTHSAGGKASGG